VKAPGWYVAFKYVLFGLLATNTVFYVIRGTQSQAVDAVAWLALLVLFEVETTQAIHWTSAVGAALRLIRVAAACLVLFAAAGHLASGSWLDAVNSALWIAVVLLLEAEVRYAGFAHGHRRFITVVAALLYSGLALMVLIWIWRADWMDAYDALLWLLGFVTIELNLLARPHGAAMQAPEPTG
jgi:hypothetical protein